LGELLSAGQYFTHDQPEVAMRGLQERAANRVENFRRRVMEKSG
jgi:hypothetical protein